MAIETGALTPFAGINFFLLGKLDARTVHQPDKGDAENFGHVRYPEIIFRLPGNPGTGHPFVVKPGQDAPFAVDSCKTVDHAGAA